MLRIHRLVIFVSVLLAFIVSGCADDLRQRNVFDAGAGDVEISFSVEKINLTRTEDSPQMESAIDHAYLLFYDADASLENAVPAAAARAEVVEANPSALTFKMPLRLEPNKNYRLLAIANADDYVPEGFSSFAAYLQSWCANSSDNKESLHLYRAESIQTDNINLLPMQGRLVDDVPFRFSMHGSSYEVSASLVFRRLVARIDVANIVKEGFVVEGVALCNWRDAVAVSSVDSQLGNRFGAVHGILSDDSENSGSVAFVDMSLAEESGVQQLSESIYCFPSASYDSYASDNESTALIIKAIYGDDAESSYYRVNVGMTGNRSEVKANTKYLVTIQSVKGRGAPTPEEAYAAKESPIVLSIVEDWDLDGCFALDDKGNFLLLSTGRLEFDGHVLENKEVKVRTSRGISWNAEYIADGDLAVSAFSATKLSDSSLAIGPTGENMEDEILSGKFIVSAQTPEGGRLSVEIAVIQNKVEDRPYEPEIPDNLPFALIPTEGERVKIDHNARKIEIDGFDPDCFNSFIDIPFQVYIKSSYGENATMTVSSTLEWPLEGQVSQDRLAEYTYCMNSFTIGTVCSSFGTEVSRNDLHKEQISLENGKTLFLSVGAMGPDDPAILRQLRLSINTESIVYSLTLKPRATIIDDVVLTDASGDSWLIMDRNIQSDVKGAGRDHTLNGVKTQAYHYCNINDMIVPFKYKNDANAPFSESYHSLYKGFDVAYGKRNTDGYGIKKRMSIWLAQYRYKDGEKRTSPFYEATSIESWLFPNRSVIGLCCEKMKASKMRMFLVSDASAKEKGLMIPVCCYWPCYYQNYPTLSTTFFRYGYTISNGSSLSGTPGSLVYINCLTNRIEINDWIPDNDDMCLSRLVRQLTAEELEDYKENYLGYGSQPHRLTICHPDTYGSEGWIPY